MDNEKETDPKEVEQLLIDVEPALLERVPPKKRNQVIRAASKAAMVLVARHTYFSGPLPPAEMLAEYDKLIPQGAERMMRLVENQSAHRQIIEKQVITAQLKESSRGQIFALVITVLLIVAGVVSAHYEAYAVAGTIFATTIAAVAGVFLYGKRQQARSLQEKRPPEQIENP